LVDQEILATRLGKLRQALRKLDAIAKKPRDPAAELRSWTRA
jgi:hypothetical protein